MQEEDLDQIREMAQKAMNKMSDKDRVEQIGHYLPIRLIPTLKAIAALIQEVNENLSDDMNPILKDNFNGLAEAIEEIHIHIVGAIGLAHPEMSLADLEKEVGDILLEATDTKGVQ